MPRPRREFSHAEGREIELFYVRAGEEIARIRNRHRLGQEVVADRMGISRPHLANIETGRTRMMLDTFAEFASIFDIDVADFLAVAQGRAAS